MEGFADLAHAQRALADRESDKEGESERDWGGPKKKEDDKGMLEPTNWREANIGRHN